MRIIVCIVFLFFVVAVRAQVTVLEVTTNKTTSLLFPSAILSIDRGSEHILVQKSTAQVLKVKADSVFADTTNLTVITTDGKLYSFLVVYASSPAVLTFDLGAGKNILNDTVLNSLAQRVRAMDHRLYGVRYSSGLVLLRVQAIYTNGNVIAVKLRIDNRSTLSYEIGGVSALLSGGNSAKRRAVQDREIPLLLTDKANNTVREKQSLVVVVIVPKAGLVPGQTLQIHVQEKGSDRQLHLDLPNKYILNAILLN